MQYENSMNTEVQEILLQKILMRERIQITSGRHRRTSFSLLIIYGFTAVLAVSFFAYLNGLTWELIGLAGLLGFSFFPLYKKKFPTKSLFLKTKPLIMDYITSINKKQIKMEKMDKFLYFFYKNLLVDFYSTRVVIAL